MGRSGGGATTGDTRANEPGLALVSAPALAADAGAPSALPVVHAPGVTAPVTPTVLLLVSPDEARNITSSLNLFASSTCHYSVNLGILEK